MWCLYAFAAAIPLESRNWTSTTSNIERKEVITSSRWAKAHPLPLRATKASPTEDKILEAEQRPKKLLREIKELLGLTEDQLVTIMKDSFASRLGDPDFREALVAFKEMLGLTTGEFVTVMTDSFASRLGDPFFR
eukprot:CAMPEP_0185768950 /NCGR_PEP_ID=MMETSP1174-20130828/53252_1 /TAXON_ID=35687 /ORGANISM="Dictyocha speculum, Strain CCMP1381" /LENGTH=134 /DNA_ID=CAMNT_0028453859 /DNA_START=117 /DNA_END=518 /DNA_ORIENTATION=-